MSVRVNVRLNPIAYHRAAGSAAPGFSILATALVQLLPNSRRQGNTTHLVFRRLKLMITGQESERSECHIGATSSQVKSDPPPEVVYPARGIAFENHHMPHRTHPDIVKRLKRADGHLHMVVTMIEEGRPCLELAQQLQAIENAIDNAKKALIHDHIAHCLDRSSKISGQTKRAALRELREITKYL